MRMKKGDKKKQQKALKKRTERKQARKQENLLQALSPLRYVRQASRYPIEGCWAQQGWDQNGLAVVVIARRQPNGNIVFGNYLVDYYCLGVKDTYFNADIPPGQFRNDALPTMYRTAGKPIKILPDLAHEIIYGGIEFAGRFGFRPHRDFAQSQSILDPPDAHPRTGKVTFGKDGKPFFVSGPYDNVDAVMRQLARTAGEGNYDFLTQIGGPSPDEWEGDEQEADEQDTLDSPRKELPDEAIELLDELDLKIGDSVAVKPGVLDPDTGQDIGGWQGRVTDIIPGEEQGSVFVSIEWDSLTLENTPAWVIEQCAKDGLNWAVMNLDIRDVEPATPRDQPKDVVKARERIAQQYPANEDEQDKRIAQVLAGVDPDGEMAALHAWDKYLARCLTFPLEAEVAEFQESGPFTDGDRVQVVHISQVDDLYGIMVHVQAKGGHYNFPLCDLEVVDRRSPNHQILDDYAVWFANR
jgi:Calcium binding